MINNVNFYDIHGNKVENGVIAVTSINHSSSQSVHYNGDEIFKDDTSEYLSFTAIYWPSAEAKNAGLPSQDFKDFTQTHMIQIPDDEINIVTTPILGHVEMYITDVLLPSMSEMPNLNGGV